MSVAKVIEISSTIILSLALLVTAGCESSGSKSGAGKSPAASQPQTVTGTVRYIDIAGGFYGIVSDAGRRLDPVNLPEEFRQDGTRVQVRVVPLKDVVTLRMWGTPVRIVEIKRLQGASK